MCERFLSIVLLNRSKKSNGLIIQWGKSTAGSSSQNIDATFSVSFSTTNYIIVATVVRDNAVNEAITIHSTTQTTTYARLRSPSNNRTANWIVIGY